MQSTTTCVAEGGMKIVPGAASVKCGMVTVPLGVRIWPRKLKIKEGSSVEAVTVREPLATIGSARLIGE
jgi:hypothetical protein